MKIGKHKINIKALVGLGKNAVNDTLIGLNLKKEALELVWKELEKLEEKTPDFIDKAIDLIQEEIKEEIEEVEEKIKSKKKKGE